MRYLFLIGAVVSLASCGGGGGRGVPSATGDISRACEASGRNAASSAMCSCVQSVADQTLSGSDQSRAVSFFKDPQRAQDTRQSDNSRDEAFWKRYKSFTDLATQICLPAA